MTQDIVLEEKAAKIHQIYCVQYEKEHGKPYWTGGDYSKLDEAAKEYDRNIVNHMENEIFLAKQETWDKAMDLVHEHDPSVGRSTSEAYWGNTLMKALKQAKEKDI